MLRYVLIVLLFTWNVCLSGASAALSQGIVRLWPRGQKCYLCAKMSMPIWPELPKSALSLSKPLILSIRMPEGFRIEAFGTSKNFALHPKPLIVPTKMEYSLEDKTIVYKIHLPVPPKSGCVRAALLVNPGDNPVGEYPIGLELKTEDGQNLWQESKAIIKVLPKLIRNSPRRLQIAVCDYAGYKNVKFRRAIADAVFASGINTIWNMSYYDKPDTIAQQLQPKGIKAAWVWVWHKYYAPITEKYPQAYELNSAGKPKPNSLCYTWCINNRQKVIQLLAEMIRKKNTPKKYDIIVNDNEERAISRDHKKVFGDLFTPSTLKEFKKQTGIPLNTKLSPEIIVKDYADQWVNFRCWQSTQMASILSDAVKLADPELRYGYYSGYEYAGRFTGFSRETYATDWKLLAKSGLDFGSAGYYGSIHDIASTAKALGDIPFIPAEMFVENFLDQKRSMPSPEKFAFRLMRSAIYGGGQGGVMVWYLQVLDAAGFYAIGTVSRVLSDIEDFLIDGTRCDSDLILPPRVDRNSVFAYKLDARRMVIIFNNSGKKKKYSLRWKTPIPKPDTVEIVSRKHLGNTSVLPVNLNPFSFEVFITLSEGN